ncbi:hypothetical protein FACS1894201_07410 [Bacteroidia bacterium]|nr:hypothetical protein FACS1894201_07410 [Bacteroidia bacterium]
MVIGITQSSMKKAYSEAHKVKTLSAFEGWQWLNNMSPIIPEIRDLDTSKIKGQKNKELHLFLLSFPDSVYSQFNMLSTGQLWGTELPPKRYLFKTMEELNIPYTQAYAKVSIVFGDYAKQLVRKYPFKYLQSYVYPSFLSTFNFYDMKADLFDNLQDCFKEKDQWFWNYYQMQPKDYHFDYSVFKPIDPIRHIAHYVYWIAGIVCTLLFLLRMKFYITEQKPRFMLLLVLILFVLAYVGGSIIAAPSTVWRYSLPFYIPSIAFMTIIINDFVAWIATKKKPLTQTNE